MKDVKYVLFCAACIGAALWLNNLPINDIHYDRNSLLTALTVTCAIFTPVIWTARFMSRGIKHRIS